MRTNVNTSRRRLLAGAAGVGALAAFGTTRALAAQVGSAGALGFADAFAD